MALGLLVALMVALAVALVLGLAAGARLAEWSDLARWGAEPAAQAAADELGAPAIVRAGDRPAVVLVHGFMGFDAIGLGPARVRYFRGAASRLVEGGHDVAIAKLPPLGAVPDRAATLVRLLDELPHDRVTIVAHSLGGLDARWALSEPRIAARVAALVTIGTPHRGTPLADLFARGAPSKLRAALARLGLTSAAVDWLTTWRMAELADALPDAPGVRYASIVGAAERTADVHPLLRPTHAYLARAAGPSDGVVPASSQRWGEVIAEEQLDHWAQVGWTLGWSRHGVRREAATQIARAVECVSLPPIAGPALGDQPAHRPSAVPGLADRAALPAASSAA